MNVDGATPLRSPAHTGLTTRTVDGHAVEWPRYSRAPTRRICHIGVGAFHRAHQAFVLHRLLQAGDAESWGICGIGLRAADRPLHAALQRQGGFYSLWELDGEQRHVTVVGAITDHIDASLDVEPALRALADAATAIVSLTVTEAGYCLRADGTLDTAHPDIAHDLADPRTPRSAPALLVLACARRRAAALPGFTAMSCDNLLANGERLKAAVCGFARRFDASLAAWIETHVSFPCSMVDRITPVTTPERRDALCAAWGVADEVPVICEPWLQWIIEDRFVAGRPPFEKAGARFSDAVPRYETMKVGLLNGGHSAIAHVGLLLRYSRVHDAVADPLIAGWLAAYQREVAEVLEAPPGVDLADYCRELARRFANPAIDDRLQRLAQDTREKFRQVLLPPLRLRLAAGLGIDALATAVALWIAYLAKLAVDAAAREAYQDVDRDALIAMAAAAYQSATSAAFVEAALPLPDAEALVLARAVDAALHELRAGDIAALLRGIATAR
jgi:mannitol 2-dehydrogenase